MEWFLKWVNEKREIERGCKVRGRKGVLVDRFGKLGIGVVRFVNF